MASGLPVVVSNWDGYRDTVLDGKTGYLIETRSFEPGWNNQNILELSINENCLNKVSTIISSQISVDSLAAGAALAKLAESPEIAVAMGSLGQQRVRQYYDWPIILNRYRVMLDELKSLRAEALCQSSTTGIETIKPMPQLTNIFSEWPSTVINNQAIVIAKGNISELKIP